MHAHVLPQHAEQHVNDSGCSQMEARCVGLASGVWANLARNPRLKLVEFGSLQWEVTLPTQVAMAACGLRLQVSGGVVVLCCLPACDRRRTRARCSVC